MISSFVLTTFLLTEQVSAHGRLTVPNTRLGDPQAYENDPIGFENRPKTRFACRHEKDPSVETAVTAGSVIDLEWRITANHVGDAGVYISYDHELADEEMHTMEFFKIANIPNTRDQPLPYHIKLPDWLPAGKAVLRWEWYALHVNPKIELYVQCADIDITAKAGSEVALSTIPTYQVVDADGTPQTLPDYNYDANGETSGPGVLYRDAFAPNNGDQFMTGPECAKMFAGNDCDRTDIDTKGWIDVGAGQTDGPVTDAPPLHTPAPTPSPVTTGTPSPVYPVSGDQFFLNSSDDFNTRKTLANIGGLLAQCAWESGGDVPWHACDENNWSQIELGAAAACSQRADVVYHEMTGVGGCDPDPSMTMSAETHASWAVPMECTPGTVTEKCCWWGRGAIQTTGPLNYGLLQSNVVDGMGLTDSTTGEAMNLCTNPEAICQNDELKFVGAVYYWTSIVQQEVCWESMIDEYAGHTDSTAWNNNGGVPGCVRFSSGVGGSINNGDWNVDAHSEAKRQTLFTNLMTEMKSGFDAYDFAAPSEQCTGDAKIDRILELGDIKAKSAMETENVYTWDGFCSTLRVFIDNSNPVDPPTTTTTTTTTTAPGTTTTTTAPPATTTTTTTPGSTTTTTTGTAPPATTTTTTTAAPATSPTGPVDESKTDGAECGGADYHGSNACATGLACFSYNAWSSSCKPSCPAGWLCETAPADLGTAFPERTVGQKCNGPTWTAADSPNSCADGLQCYKRNWDNTPSSWSGCYNGSPAEGWVVEN